MSNQMKVIFKEMGRTVNRNSPTILTGLGVAGFFTSIVMAVKATPKALEMIEEAKFQEGKFAEEQGYDLVFGHKEIAQVVWPVYIPTFGMALLSATSIIMANRINLRRNAALVSLYTIAESSLRDYQAKVVETIGEKKEEKIRGEVAQKQLDDNPLVEGNIVITGRGEMLCLETLSGRYFKSDPETLRQAMNEFGARLLREMELPVNELYDDMGLDPTDLGASAGWKADDGLPLFDFSSRLESRTNQLCLVVGYTKQPKALWF